MDEDYAVGEVGREVGDLDFANFDFVVEPGWTRSAFDRCLRLIRFAPFRECFLLNLCIADKSAYHSSSKSLLV